MNSVFINPRPKEIIWKDQITVIMNCLEIVFFKLPSQ
jgi:hypothetical protein